MELDKNAAPDNADVQLAELAADSRQPNQPESANEERPVSPHVHLRRFNSGIVTRWANDGDVQAFADAVIDSAAGMDASCVFLFHSNERYNATTLANAFTDLPSCTELVGCSSSGELTPDGLVEGHAVAILLPRNRFTVVTTVLDKVSELGMDELVTQVKQLREELANTLGCEDLANVFAINLIDGLGYSEESVTAALNRGLEDIPLIGGSAGDDLQFRQTSQIHNRHCYQSSAVLTLVHSTVPFELFTYNNFVPTENKLVVTESDLDKRNVREFNAEPAAVAYANAVGLDPDNLTPDSFASHPVVVKVGGEYYCRSIQKCEEDHSLTFFCAIDDGIVLTIAESTGMLKSTRRAIENMQRSLNGIDMILGFDCILRRLDARNRGGLENISKLYAEANVVGFGTYGEQFNSMHINQTFTGVAFGSQPE